MEPVAEEDLNIGPEITESFERDDTQGGITSDLLPTCRLLSLLTTDVVDTMVLEEEATVDADTVSMEDDDDILFIGTTCCTFGKKPAEEQYDAEKDDDFFEVLAAVANCNRSAIQMGSIKSPLHAGPNITNEDLYPLFTMDAKRWISTDSQKALGIYQRKRCTATV
ncbi:unnamed protein product [Didymodactylos carnosus]|uniref:Uncharacterized protein n=1 Tax=Didymodactylos carnosus TaxID=1234261 RepID=A0A813XQK0_9BILA|nr:unnamed protein product [Didymodactylos carnosus]CAF3661059.1 unnamed protein product [Didymodactylos carnosus]